MFRTPAKSTEKTERSRVSPSGEERAGPSPKEQNAKKVNVSVRRSIGEWEQETRNLEPERQVSPSKPMSVVRTKKTTLTQQLLPLASQTLGAKSPDKAEAEPETLRKSDRMVEAKAYLEKARTHLNNFRNFINGH